MQDTYQTLVQLLLPDGLLDYFELTSVSKGGSGLNIYLEEKNSAPSGYQTEQLESKGFLPETSIQDFPIRGQKRAVDGKLKPQAKSLPGTGIWYEKERE